MCSCILSVIITWAGRYDMPRRYRETLQERQCISRSLGVARSPGFCRDLWLGSIDSSSELLRRRIRCHRSYRTCRSGPRKRERFQAFGNETLHSSTGTMVGRRNAHNGRSGFKVCSELIKNQPAHPQKPCTFPEVLSELSYGHCCMR